MIIGMYAQARYLPDREKTLTATVARWRDYLPSRIVLPHPSPRNQRWLAANPWFMTETIPAAQDRVQSVLGQPVGTHGLITRRIKWFQVQ